MEAAGKGKVPAMGGGEGGRRSVIKGGSGIGVKDGGEGVELLLRLV
jgi:hypothetical protein